MNEEQGHKINAILKGNLCPLCGKKSLTLTEVELDIPFFGKTYLFSMTCSNCNYHTSDVEAAERHEPARYTFEVTAKEDLNVRVVKSSEAIVKIPYIGEIKPGTASEGYVTNIEGLITKIKEQIEHLRDSEEDEETRKKAKNLLKKIQRVLWGEEKIKVIIEDKTGNSAIISEKAIKTKLK
ncbi:MAG: ZPR1 zinc finger domain-containing protein [Candidatus Woesearchaeota archaeon]